MSKSIELHFIWNKDLALQTSKLYYDYDMRHSNKRYIGWLFVALVQFGIVGALKHDSYGLLYLSTFLVGYWYYGRWLLRKRVLLNFYKKKSPDNIEMHFIIDDEGLHTESEFILWDDINKIVALEDGILIQSTKDVFFFKESAFDTKDASEQFLKLARVKGKI